MESKHNQKVKKNNWPATLYVEGQDQFRGWFNSSLITSVILTDQAPYQQVLSHGFVVDEKGHKMSKSLGNVIYPEDIIRKFGADVLRLWVASSDFTKEVKVGIPILEKVQESYQKIRNTLRFLLSNLSNLPPGLKSEADLEKDLNIVDYYILYQLEKLLSDSQKRYKEYNFSTLCPALLNFCINDLSAFYFEISKDSLYCDSINSLRRKQIITTLYYLLGGLLKIISPILPYLAEEVYQNIPFHFGLASQNSVHLLNYTFPITLLTKSEKKIAIITSFFLPLRHDVFQALERARQENIINSNLQAILKICLKEQNHPNYSELNLTELLLVSAVKIQEKREENMWVGNFCLVKVEKNEKERCLRCRNWRELKNEICLRCGEIYY